MTTATVHPSAEITGWTLFPGRVPGISVVNSLVEPSARSNNQTLSRAGNAASAPATSAASGLAAT